MTSTDINDTSTELINYNPPELETLRLDVLPGKIVVLTINRPERMNSHTVQMFTEYNTVAYALPDNHARALINLGAE